jgi:plasmid stabilization system protein ParE
MLIEYLPGARFDFDESFDWYTERSTQAAARFAEAIDAALQKIVASPTMYASLDGLHRECPLKKFPFRIVYRIAENRVIVVAVAHAKRRPGYWKNREG